MLGPPALLISVSSDSDMKRSETRSPLRSFLGLIQSAFLTGAAALAVVPVVSYGDDSASALSQMVSKVRYFTLSNGLRVVMYDRGTAPVFAGAVVVRVGGSDELPGETGISHMFEHMAFKGTKTVGTKDYAKEKVLLDRLEEIAAASSSANDLSPEQKKEWDSIHAELKELWITDDFTRRYERQGGEGQNATTDKEFTKYFVNLPRSAFEFWCKMESDRLINPVMRQFYQEREVVREERRMRFEDDPDGKLYELLLGVSFQRHPYRTPVIGYDPDIRSLTATELENFRKIYYVPSNIVISLVGRVDPDADIKMVEEYFGRIPVGPAVSRSHVMAEEPQQGERRASLRFAASPKLIVAYHKPNYPHADDPPISVLAEILSGGHSSPLYTELVKKRQIAADIGTQEGPGIAYPNLLFFSASVKTPNTTDTVLSAFDSVLAKFKQHGPSLDQLERAKRSIGVDYLEHLKSNQSLALDFASSELVYGSWKESVTWFDKMNQVTIEDVRRVADQYLVPDQRTIATIERAAAPGHRE